MTRSLGDLCVKNHGVFARPEVAEWSFEDSKDALLILATDGVFEFLESTDVTRLVLENLGKAVSRQETLQKVVDMAKTKWEEHEGQEYCDDITAILLPVGAPGLPAAVPARSRCLPCCG